MPLIEVTIDQVIKDAFPGRPVPGAEAEVAFWPTAGYDFVPTKVGLHTFDDPRRKRAMDIVRLKETVGDRPCLMGNVGLDLPLSRGTLQDVESEVKQKLRGVAPGGGYCLGSSNSIAHFVPLENFNAMRETVFKYGTYPISI